VRNTRGGMQLTTRTATERRELAAIEYNAFVRDCPTHKLLSRISDKWVSLTLVALADGPLRYSELARTMAGISQKMLTQTVRSLERDGIVARNVTPSVPVRVDYRLTPLGETLLPLMRQIKTWAELHLDEVEEHRAHYDILACESASVGLPHRRAGAPSVGRR
jgi:DNA-binding HxlR family transcriptional regulator